MFYLRKIIESNSFLSMKKFISIFLSLFFSLFINVSDVFSREIENKLNNNVPKDSKTKNIKLDNNDMANKSKPSYEDIFGDEQAFPFVAGLGKNAAH